MDANYAEKFQDAEKAVSSIKDDKLKAIAFEKLINHILGDSDKSKETTTRVSKKEAASGSRGQKKSDGPKAWLLELVEETFFQNPKSMI